MPETVIIIVQWLFIITTALYALQILRWTVGIIRLPTDANSQLPSFDILIAARNEEATIESCLNSLLALDYPINLFHITLIDDQSSDKTVDISRRFADRFPDQVSMLLATDRPHNISPKIYALDLAIKNTSQEIIAVTDADCIVSPTWLKELAEQFTPETGVVTGPAVYLNRTDVDSLLFGIQHIDFISHNAVCAGSIGSGNVNTAIGCNMAFRRKAFLEVDGFTRFQHFNSGYDSFLAQTISGTGSWKARFMPTARGTVTTSPVQTWGQFLNQRARWSAQTSEYRLTMMVFMISTFIMYLMIIFLLPFAFLYDVWIPVYAWGVKTAMDFIILFIYTTRFRLQHVLPYFIPAAVIHIPFTLLAVLAGYFYRYEWKNRKLGRSFSK